MYNQLAMSVVCWAEVWCKRRISDWSVLVLCNQRKLLLVIQDEKMIIFISIEIFLGSCTVLVVSYLQSCALWYVQFGNWTRGESCPAAAGIWDLGALRSTPKFADMGSLFSQEWLGWENTCVSVFWLCRSIRADIMDFATAVGCISFYDWNLSWLKGCRKQIKQARCSTCRGPSEAGIHLLSHLQACSRSCAHTVSLCGW